MNGFDELSMMLKQGKRYEGYHKELSKLDKLNRSIDNNKILQTHKKLMSYIQQGDFSESRDTCHRCIEIKESPIHGWGVFATRDISKGQIITQYYPAYLLDKTEGCFIEAESGRNCPINEMVNIVNKLSNYQIEDINRHCVYGEPSFKSEWSMLGHMINDLSYDGSEDYKWDKGNVYINRDLTVLTTRYIKSGEEISYNYGLPFWFQPSQKFPRAAR